MSVAMISLFVCVAMLALIIFVRYSAPDDSEQK